MNTFASLLNSALSAPLLYFFFFGGLKVNSGDEKNLSCMNVFIFGVERSLEIFQVENIRRQELNTLLHVSLVSKRLPEPNALKLIIS